jgi:hypothetical protein
MKSLEERLSERKAIYDKLVQAELWADEAAGLLGEIVPLAKVDVSVYESGAYFYINAESIEEAELDFIPSMSEKFGLKWRKDVSSSYAYPRTLVITYHVHLYGYKPNFYLCFMVTPTIEDSCIMQKIPTGRTIMRQKYVEVEEPEYEYAMHCPGE